MLPKMQASPFVKKYSVQFVNSKGRESAPFYFWDNKPHECSQTWQVVRSEFDKMMLDNAREHGVDASEGVRVLEVLFDGDRAVGVRIRDEAEQRSRGVRQGHRRRQRSDGDAAEPLQAAALGSGAQQGRHLDVLGERVPRQRARRRRHARHSDRRQAGLVLVHPPARQRRQHRRGRAVLAPVQQASREPREDLRGRSRERAGRQAAPREREAHYRLFRDQGLLVSRERGGRPRLGARRRRVRLPRSAVLVGRAARAQIRTACR